MHQFTSFHVALSVVALPLTATTQLLAQTAATWHLQLDHAIRPAEGTPGMIGNVMGLALARDGSVYVTERDPGRVTRYDASGKFVDVFMRAGSGPGEVRLASIALQGDTLVAYDGMQHRLTRLSPAKRVLSERTLDINAVGFGVWTTRTGTILVEEPDSAHGLNHHAVRLALGKPVDTLAWSERFSDHQFVQYKNERGVIKGGPFSAAPSAVVDPDGHVVVGGSAHSAWFVVNERDTLQRVVLPDHAVPIPASVRDSAWQAFVARFANGPMASALNKDLLPKTLPAWVSLDIAPTGEWWIGRPGMDGKLASWDVIDHGKVIGHVALPARLVSGPGIHPIALSVDRIALLHQDENDVPWIGVYRVVRR
jgi:hypothetical protein